MLKVTIINWRKYNPRKDVKKPSWFRVQNNLLSQQQFWSFNNGEMLGLIHLMSLASESNSDSFFLDFGYAERVCRIQENDMIGALEKLVTLEFIKVHGTLPDRKRNVDVTCTVRAREADVTATGLRTEQACPATNERTNERTVIIADPPAAPAAPPHTSSGDAPPKPKPTKPREPTEGEIEAIYLAHYPRKEGKARGIKIALRDLKTPDDLAKLKFAILAYAKKKTGKDPEFLMHFDTFMGEWKDWLDPSHGTSDAPSKSKIAEPARPARDPATAAAMLIFKIKETFSSDESQLPGDVQQALRAVGGWYAVGELTSDSAGIKKLAEMIRVASEASGSSQTA